MFNVAFLSILILVSSHLTEGQESCQSPKISTLSTQYSQLSVLLEDGSLSLQLQNEGRMLLEGTLGKSLPKGIEPTECSDSNKEEICLNFGTAGDLARLSIRAFDDTCYDITWTTNVINGFKDCFVLNPQTKWFGGPEEYYQHFPMDHSANRKSVPYLPGDMLQDKDKYFGGVAEPYWLSSKGVAVHVPLGKSLVRFHPKVTNLKRLSKVNINLY